MPSRYRVAAGYATGLVALVLARPTLRTILLGFALALLGEALRLWASGHLEKTRRLATGGPYAHTRNPLYLGSLLMALGMAIAAASPWVVLAVASYFLAFYPTLMNEEARFLRERFGAEYDRWAAEVPPFWPRPGAGGSRASRFARSRVRGNREWWTAAVLPLVALLFWARRFCPWP